MPFHLQAIDYLSSLLQIWHLSSPWPNQEQENWVKLRFKVAAESEPMEYIHWKRLGYVYLVTGEYVKSLNAYKQAKTLGMNSSDFTEACTAIQELAGRQNLEQANINNV
jgi:cytochrome c-type biogenesis protein CcmH/NrfG